MKAVIASNYGSEKYLHIKEILKPVPNKNEVLIKICASTVNRTDCAIHSAKPFFMRFMTGLFKPKNPILGTEFAGQIEAVGSEVKKFKVGDRVFGFDDSGMSSHAEYVALSEDKPFITMPKNISFEEAAASIEGAHYAYNFINKVEIKEGSKVLINGATGGIGSAALQLIKNIGAEVTAVCNTKNIELMKILGANKIIDYLTTDFTNDDDRYDFVFDTVGKSSFGKCKNILKPGGIYISSELGAGAQNVFFSLITPITSGKLNMCNGKMVKFPFPSDVKRTLKFIKKLIEEEKFKTVIDRKYTLDQIANAYKYVKTGEKTGNVVVVNNFVV